MASSLHPHSVPGRGPLLLILLLTLPLLLATVASLVFNHPFQTTSLFTLGNLVGPTTESLLKGDGLTACTIAMGTIDNPICFHAGRMPLPSLIVALGVRLFGDHFLPVAFLKMLLLLLPLEAALYLVWRCLPRDRTRQILITLLLLAPFTITALLADVVNLQVEEGYTYSFLALAVAILFFAMRPVSNLPAAQPKPTNRTPHSGLLLALLFALSVDALYLAKSAMVPATFVLTVAFLYTQRRASLRIVVLLLVAAAPVGWALHQHHAGGRYSLGTSIDGINLHKGNNAIFAANYPPPPGESLDRFDPDLNHGLVFPDEWSFNDYHQHAAVAWLRAHPRETLSGDARKLFIIFLTTRKLGSSESHGLLLAAETAGLLLFRLLLWAAIGGALYGLVRHRRWKLSGAIFLALLSACALPYLLGFAYVRHVSILIYPSVLMCCAILADDPPSEAHFSSSAQAVH